VIEPFYQDDHATLYLGDATEVIPEMKTSGVVVDLLCTDPPYGVKFRSNRGENFDAIAGDDSAEVGHVVLGQVLASRLLRSSRHVYAFGPFDFEGLPLVKSDQELVWDKGVIGMGDLTLPWAPQHEPIQFGVYVPSKANRRDGDGKLSARLRRGSVLSVQRKNSRGVNRHPMEKPVELMSLLIESSSVRGEVVFDPFAGCGSTLVASTLLGRRSIGVELDVKYATVAAERLAKAHKLATEMVSA
jgi:DNA modification methylase